MSLPENITRAMLRAETLRGAPIPINERTQANPSPDCPRTPAIVECDPRDATLVASQAKAGDRKRVLVRFTAIRKRLLDEDNLCAKYHCDLLRYAGVIPDDAPDRCRIETRQVKAGKGETEEVRIEVFEL